MRTRDVMGANLKRFREAAGLTQTEVGDALGLTWQTVSNYETGARWPREPDVVDALAKVLKVRPWQLLAAEGEGGAIPPELAEHIAAAARICGLTNKADAVAAKLAAMQRKPGKAR